VIPGLPDDPGSRHVLLVVVVATAAFLAHHYGPWRERVHLSRFAGALLLGGPALFWRPGALGVPMLVPGAAFLGFVLLLLPIVALSARRPESWKHYPEDRRDRWDAGAFGRNAASWAAYLVGYELFFRGLLLLTLADAYGPWPALALTTSIYAAAHFHKPAGEALGTLPMGFAFGLATLASGSVWPAIVGHLAIALTNDAVAIRARHSATIL
jgi:membrane protease YdiL (CAAX protease family)